MANQNLFHFSIHFLLFFKFVYSEEEKTLEYPCVYCISVHVLNELLIACVSRTFTKTERSYSTIKKEVLALLYTLRTMDFYIRFSKHLTILTDAQGILFLSMCKDSQGILLRFSLELSKYQAEIIHVPGENNETADVLSRHHADIEKIQQEHCYFHPYPTSYPLLKNKYK